MSSSNDQLNIEQILNKILSLETRMSNTELQLEDVKSKVLPLPGLVEDMSVNMLELFKKNEFMSKFNTDELAKFGETNSKTLTNNIPAKEPPRNSIINKQMTLDEYFVYCFTAKIAVQCGKVQKLFSDIIRSKIYQGKDDPYNESIANDAIALQSYAEETYKIYSDLGNNAPCFKQLNMLYARYLENNN